MGVVPEALRARAGRAAARHRLPRRPAAATEGWLWHAFSVGAEVLAWHLNRSWAFLRSGGVPAMAARHGLDVEQAKVVSGGNIGLHLLRRLAA